MTTKAKKNGKAKQPVGRPPTVWDFKAVEKYGAKGHKSAATVCRLMGISPKTFEHQTQEVKEAFRGALLKGNAVWTDKLLDQASDRVPKNDIMLLMALKQEHGPDWDDKRSSVQYGGKIEVVVTHSVGHDAAIDITPDSAAPSTLPAPGLIGED